MIYLYIYNYVYTSCVTYKVLMVFIFGVKITRNIQFWTSMVVHGWQSTCQCRGHRFSPWSRKTPHASEQLSPWTTATEDWAPRAFAPQQKMRSPCTAVTSSLRSPQLEKAHAQQWRPSAVKKIKITNLLKRNIQFCVKYCNIYLFTTMF